MKYRNILVTLVFFALAAFSQIAFAQSAPAPAEKQSGTGSFFTNLEGTIRTFTAQFAADTSGDSKLVKSMRTKAYEIAGKMKQPALQIGGALALIYLLWETIQFFAGNRQSFVTIFFDVGIPCMFAVLLVSNYQDRMNEFDKLLDVFRLRDLGGSPINTLMSIYGSVLADIGRAIKDLFDNVVSISSWFKSPGKQLANFADFLATLLFALVILFLILQGVAEILGLLLMGPFLCNIGVAFGPLLIIGIVTPWTSDFFKKWVQFVIVSAALTGVINVILTIASSVIGEGGMGLSSLTGNQPTAAGMIVVTLLLLTVNALISQAPGITSALMPGHIGAHKGAGEGVRKAAEVGKKGAKNGASGTAKGVKLGAKGTAKGVSVGFNATKMGFKLAKGAVGKIYKQK